MLWEKKKVQSIFNSVKAPRGPRRLFDRINPDPNASRLRASQICSLCGGMLLTLRLIRTWTLATLYIIISCLSSVSAADMKNRRLILYITHTRKRKAMVLMAMKGKLARWSTYLCIPITLLLLLLLLQLPALLSLSVALSSSLSSSLSILLLFYLHNTTLTPSFEQHSSLRHAHNTCKR